MLSEGLSFLTPRTTGGLRNKAGEVMCGVRGLLFITFFLNNWNKLPRIFKTQTGLTKTCCCLQTQGNKTVSEKLL